LFFQKGEFADWLYEYDPQDKDSRTKMLQALSKIFKQNVLETYELGGELLIPPPLPAKPSAVAARAAEPVIRGQLKGMTGQGVLVAVIDSGVDFRHPDFQDATGRSRIRWYWDTQLPYREGRGQPGPYTYPNGTPIGTLF